MGSLAGASRATSNSKRTYAAPVPALAQDTEDTSPALGLPPGNPQTAALPGGVTPAYHRPATEFVGGFIGNSNFLQGHVVARQGAEIELELEGGQRLRLPSTTPSAGNRVRIMVRPEALELAPAAPAGGIALPVTVTERIFLGDATTYQVATADRRTLVVRQPLRQAEQYAPGVGEAAFASAKPGAFHVFPVQ